jgi:outer membrane protein assembly factor BamB
MHRLISAGLMILLIPAVSCSSSEGPQPASAAAPVAVAPGDWAWWRGPTRDGIAPAGQTPPMKWSDTEGILWKTPVPGRGHGSPIVVGDRVILAAAEPDSQIQSLLCFDRKTGKQLWKTEIHRGGFEKKGNAKSSHASSTPASDGDRVFINFLHSGAIHATALSLDGKQLWQTKVADYVAHQGFGSSPAVYRSLVILSADSKGGGVIAGLDPASGSIVWKKDRPKLPNYTSPIILTAAGKEQLVMTGCDLVTGLDPLTGKTLWETRGSTTECVTSTVTDGNVVFTSGGYPKNHVSAVAADGSGKVVWENKSRVYVPSMLVHQGHLYAVQDDGIAVCRKPDTGEEKWNGRLGGTFSASPVLVGEHIFATNEAGKTFIFKATPDDFELLGENQLGNEMIATPVFAGNRIYMRAAVKDKGGRQEYLYCIGAD